MVYTRSTQESPAPTINAAGGVFSHVVLEEKPDSSEAFNETKPT
jgi:hypothetical protein